MGRDRFSFPIPLIVIFLPVVMVFFTGKLDLIKELDAPVSFSTVKVTYLDIRSAHERVWLVERKPI